MSYESILQNLENKKYKPIYFLQGEETYRITQLVQYIERHVIPTHARSFDQTILYGGEVTMNQIISHAKRFPMLATHQVVIVKEAQSLSDLHREEGQKKLLHYLEKPNPATLLIFAYKGKTLDQRKTLTKKIAQKTVFFTSKKMYEREIPSWIKSQVTQQGITITEEATHMLVTLVGSNLQVISNELQKIITNLKQGATLTHDMVRQHVSQTKGYDLFGLQQAFQQHNTDEIWAITHYFTQNPKKYPLLPQITLLSNFFYKLLTLHQHPKAPLSQIASLLRIPPFFAKNYKNALFHYPLQKIVKNIHHLHQADLQMKGINYPAMGEEVIFKQLVANLL